MIETGIIRGKPIKKILNGELFGHGNNLFNAGYRAGRFFR
jgi:hypothetical protein